jgi:hypothetical protein
MRDEYGYRLEECDVPEERRGALESFRAKRLTWLSWIDTDEHHAIWTVLSSMVWTDVSFRTLTQFAIDDENSSLHNSLLTEALFNGYAATQVLAIRRLMDTSNLTAAPGRRFKEQHPSLHARKLCML